MQNATIYAIVILINYVTCIPTTLKNTGLLQYIYPYIIQNILQDSVSCLDSIYSWKQKTLSYRRTTPPVYVCV